MDRCLFCNGDGPFSTVEHIVPESLGNHDLVLCGEICDRCQAYFGQKVEQPVLGKTPIAAARAMLSIRTKKGALPSVDLSQPKRDKGTLPSTHEAHDDVGFTAHEDGSVSLDVYDDRIVRLLLDQDEGRLQIVMTPKMLSLMGRFFCKIGIELLCMEDRNEARSSQYAQAREFSRYGRFKGLWPIFHWSDSSFRADRGSTVGYRHSLIRAHGYVLLVWGIGADNWLVSLNDPFPTPVIRKAVPGDLQLIWYSDIERG